VVKRLEVRADMFPLFIIKIQGATDHFWDHFKDDLLYHQAGLAVTSRFENLPLLTSQVGVST
jgi:hypothetical protein